MTTHYIDNQALGANPQGSAVDISAYEYLAIQINEKF